MEKFQKISVIIVNYRSKKHLEKCLFSLKEKVAQGIISEIIVVNNDKEENLHDLAFSQNIKIIQAEKNLGFGAANNLGAGKAEGDILFFLNPDTEILSKNINDIFREFENNSRLGILGAGLLDSGKKKQPWSAGKEMNLFRLMLNNIGFETSRKIWESKKKIKAHWVAGTAFFIKKKLFLAVGGFDENFFMYFEDMDLCKKIRKAGKEVFYYPDFSVLHLGGKSYESKKSQKRDYYVSQDYYFEKHFGKIQAKLIKFFRKFLVR